MEKVSYSDDRDKERHDHTHKEDKCCACQANYRDLHANPGFDDSSDIFFSQPWVLRSSQGKFIAEFKDNYPVKSGPTALHMSVLEDGAPSIEQWVAGLEKSKQYTLSTWVAYKSGSEGCHIDLKLGKTLIKRHTISKGSPGQYRKVEGVVATKYQMDLVSMWLYCPSEATVAILVDDVNLEEIM
ncbi:hypothetical protein FLAG1_06491 [Fusarium langsethiae]|uniref:Uncharacterized protein n=1 Tax=Fusarium langsethiae TaxID=179993 RepID=A0A0M9EVR1_FUSLA|nr:hypothetical protein FLAG1_06491 [Fusarium langsethiae]GKU07195.1 unnamed protein product [Fusarium langsethiae]GKU21209.1 unnamed protein product [Fusarium langsethiae]